MWKNPSSSTPKESFECDSSYNNEPRQNSIMITNVKHPEDIYTLTHALNRATIMDKWNLKFSGEDDFSLSEFLQKLELNARADNLCKDDVFITFFRLLKGNALNWYEGCYDTFTNWTELVAGLKYRFQPIEYDFYLRQEIKLRVQQLDEPAPVYLTHMTRLFRKLDPPLTESDKVFIIQKNMLPRYAMQLVLRNVKSVDHISKLCKMIDESGQASSNEEPLEPSCYPPKKVLPVSTVPKRNFPKPLKIVVQANKEIEAAENLRKTGLPKDSVSNNSYDGNLGRESIKSELSSHNQG